MRFEVLLTRDAERHVEELYACIAAHDSAGHADRVLDRIEKALKRLRTLPERGSHAKELLALGIREYRQVFFRPYRLTCRMAGERVHVYPRQIPVTRLGRLATRHDLQGQGLGRLLLADAVTRSRNAALSVGSAGIFVDAKNGAAARFCKQYGFTPCMEEPLKLYLPMWQSPGARMCPPTLRHFAVRRSQCTSARGASS